MPTTQIYIKEPIKEGRKSSADELVPSVPPSVGVSVFITNFIQSLPSLSLNMPFATDAAWPAGLLKIFEICRHELQPLENRYYGILIEEIQDDDCATKADLRFKADN